MDGLIDVEEACLVGIFDGSMNVAEKINELILAHNKLVIFYSRHYHKHSDSYGSIFTTTGPEELSEFHNEG